MHQITLQDARTRLANVLGEVLDGEEIIITDHEKPVVRMSPLSPPTGPHKRVPGSAKGLIWIADDFDAPLDDFKEYM